MVGPERPQGTIRLLCEGIPVRFSAAVSTLASFIESMSRPEAYPHQPERVEVLQTHISVLFFAGDNVYKVKKPVNPGFLDYSTLDKRKHFCEEEVRLNRRLAPETYRGVVPIVRHAAGAVRVGAIDEQPPSDADIIEYAVLMDRLPANAMLSARLERGEIDNAQLNDIAQLLADFHKNCATGEGVNEHATADAIEQQVEENFRDLEGSCHADETSPDKRGILSQRLHSHLLNWCQRYLRQQRDLFTQRVEQGRIRDGHGDLHAGNICLLDDRPPRQGGIVIYDCIEFTPRFRCRDVACELAFLAMGLDRRGYRGFARYLISRYAALTDDDDLETLVPFYKLHLAMVRAKVEAMRSESSDVDDDERRRALCEARGYAHLAASYTLTPAVIIMTGLPGSGKSWAARAAAQPFEAAVLRSDVIRKQLAGLLPTERVSQDEQDVVYSQSFTERTYNTLFERATEALGYGRTVVLDAVFSTVEGRQRAVEWARHREAKFVVVHTHAPEDVIRQRMQKRAADDREVSDADWAVYEQAKQRYEPPDEIDAVHRVEVTHETEADDVAAAIIDRMIQQLPVKSKA